MYVLFVDESGTPPKVGDQKPDYFVVGGIIIPEQRWHSLRDPILGMKLRRKIRGEFKWRYFAPDNDEPQNPMRRLKQSERDSIREEIYATIRQHRSTRAMAAV